MVPLSETWPCWVSVMERNIPTTCQQMFAGSLRVVAVVGWGGSGGWDGFTRDPRRTDTATRLLCLQSSLRAWDTVTSALSLVLCLVCSNSLSFCIVTYFTQYTNLYCFENFSRRNVLIRLFILQRKERSYCSWCLYLQILLPETKSVNINLILEIFVMLKINTTATATYSLLNSPFYLFSI